MTNKPFFLVLFIYLFSMHSLNIHAQELPHDKEQSCNTRYPVLLVHGIGYRDDIKIYPYWRNIPDSLKARGAKVFLSNHNAIGTHEQNAYQIKKRINEILAETNAEKINIIAHSKGGIDSRYMISHLKMADKVASLTTIATPHRGAILSNYLMEKVYDFRIKNLVVGVGNIYARMLGDKDPKLFIAAIQLTPDYMKKFNQQVKDNPAVYYQSFGGCISAVYPGLIGRSKYKMIYRSEGENDGVVSVQSYKWGNFRGIVSAGNKIGVSHLEIIGQENGAGFDYVKFFNWLVADLKKMGF